MLWLCIRLPALQREALAADEDEALARLSAWAYQWSSQVCHRRSDETRAPLLWLEISGSRALFGEPAALLARIGQALHAMGYSHSCAIAPSPAAAALLTQGQAPRCLLTQAQLQTGLASLPLHWLELPAHTRDALRSAGLSRIGEVLVIPRAALARRFGPECCDYLLRLMCQLSDPRPCFQLPEVYRARCVFDHELHDTQRLLFALQRLLQEFQGYLRGRDRAVLGFTLELEHVRRAVGSRSDAGHSQLPIGLSTPTREAARFLVLVRERLHNLVLSAPVTALSVRADAFTAPAVMQADLFDSDDQRFGELTDLLDRLHARLGTQAVQTLQLQADHRPERAFASVPAASMPTRPPKSGSAAFATSPAPSSTAPSPRPLALLPHPRRIDAPALLLGGPERIASGWWDGGDVVRDYYIARGSDGSRQWVFHDLRDHAWYLQGLWT